MFLPAAPHEAARCNVVRPRRLEADRLRDYEDNIPESAYEDNIPESACQDNNRIAEAFTSRMRTLAERKEAKAEKEAGRYGRSEGLPPCWGLALPELRGVESPIPQFVL